MTGSQRERKPWTHRPYQGQDLAGVAELREGARILTEGSERRSGTPQYYAWKLEANSTAPGLLEVALGPDEAVVGTASLTPKRILMEGTLQPAAEIGDTFTSPAYQRHGIFSTLVRTLVAGGRERGIDFIYGTPNEASLAGYEAKLDFVQIPGAAVQGLVRPLRARPVMQRRLGAGRTARLAATVGGPLVDMLYGAVYRPARVRSGVEIRRSTEFPPEAEVLFEAVKDSYRWIVVRDARYLSWRFRENPDDYAFLSAHRDGTLQGYVTLKRGRWNGLDVLYLADFLCSGPEVFESLLGEVLRGAMPWAHMVSVWTAAEGFHADTLRRAGFLRYGRIPVICYGGTDLGRSVADGSRRWHFTMADSDNI